MAMAVFYAGCIVQGLRTYKHTPKFLKAKVKEILIALELEELITE